MEEEKVPSKPADARIVRAVRKLKSNIGHKSNQLEENKIKEEKVMSRASNRKGTQILSDKNINPLGQINTNNPTATAYNPSFTIKPPTIKIQQIATIPNCSKYEIVRCIRTFADKRTITQGLIGRPAESWNAHPN